MSLLIPSLCDLLSVRYTPIVEYKVDYFSDSTDPHPERHACQRDEWRVYSKLAGSVRSDSSSTTALC